MIITIVHAEPGYPRFDCHCIRFVDILTRNSTLGERAVPNIRRIRRFFPAKNGPRFMQVQPLSGYSSGVPRDVNGIDGSDGARRVIGLIRTSMSGLRVTVVSYDVLPGGFRPHLFT